MSPSISNDSGTRLRLWPGVLIVAVLWLTRLGAPLVDADAGTEFLVRTLGGFVGALAVVTWWLFFSRAPWSDRLTVIAVIIVALAATRVMGHDSMVVWLLWYSAPLLSVALVAGAVASRWSTRWRPRTAIAAAVVLTCGATTLVRIGGVTGNGFAEFNWRWAATAEEQLLARASAESLPAAKSRPADADRFDATPTSPASRNESPTSPLLLRATTVRPDAGLSLPPASASSESIVNWPGFRGRHRNGVLTGVSVETDWSASPPIKLWQREVGPGWSSFAVRGDLFYTQEQRGDEEIVSAYNVRSGKPVWRHRDLVRFDEPMGGPGPRSTPTFDNDRVYTFGPTGILNALDAADGTVVWSRNAASDVDVPIPMWGFASSPLVVDDLVIVAISGTLAAYGRETGNPRWSGPNGGDSYSSPHLATVDGVPQVLLVSAAGTIGVTPVDGAVLWRHPWDSRMPVVPIVQPASMDDGSVFVGDSMLGVRRINVARTADGWTVGERWLSNRLKPYFNDFVLHRGHAYGFDGAILACVDLADGARKWKGGRYGQGQLVLLPDQDVLLVLSEEGELVLVKAAPDQFRELARVPAISGKTWNHPVLVGDVLLVRNGEEMAAFRLSRAHD